MEAPVEVGIENKVSEETPFSIMQKQFDELTDSMGKVRRKLFGELAEMKKVFVTIQKENEDLKSMLKEIEDGKIRWSDRQECSVFDVSKHQEAAG